LLKCWRARPGQANGQCQLHHQQPAWGCSAARSAARSAAKQLRHSSSTGPAVCCSADYCYWPSSRHPTSKSRYHFYRHMLTSIFVLQIDNQASFSFALQPTPVKPRIPTGPPVYTLIRAQTVADVWREYKESIAGALLWRSWRSCGGRAGAPPSARELPGVGVRSLSTRSHAWWQQAPLQQTLCWRWRPGGAPGASGSSTAEGGRIGMGASGRGAGREGFWIDLGLRSTYITVYMTVNVGLQYSNRQLLPIYSLSNASYSGTCDPSAPNPLYPL
jgi:hypothetical protein